MKKILVLVVFMCTCMITYAQQTQIVKGFVTDKVSEKPIKDALIVIGSLKSTTADDGGYSITNVPIGRINLMVIKNGYKTITIPEILITVGKEVIIDISMDQNLEATKDIIIKSSTTKKGNATNEFAGASSRSITMEEVTRFAGGRNDPSKLVSSFAGVTSNSDSRNDIVVRGNSPTGVLWRIEGLPTPSPNHFATSGTTGGPVSALNTNALKKSDFYTGAFSAEFGNATAAVFDMQLRTGNKDKHEKTFQINAFSGMELMLEGPLSNKKNGASYLVGYRYSFAKIGQSLGLNIGTAAVPNYQDWVFNIQLAKSKAGKINIFGMGGISSINFIGKDTDSTDFYARNDQDAYNKGNFNVFGMKHSIDISSKSYLRSALSFSTTKNFYDQYQYDVPLTYTNKWLNFSGRTSSQNIRFTSYINTKTNAKLSFRHGLVAEWLANKEDVISRDGLPSAAPFAVLRAFDGNALLTQGFSQFRYKLNDAFAFSGGLHGMHYSLNNTSVIEPRFGINYNKNNNSFQFNYGLHSQQQPLPIYLFQKNVGGVIDQSNKDLDFTKAHHFVLGYEKRFLKDWRIKAEAYYQSLFNVPVEKTATGFSILNTGADFVFPEKTGLVNEGTGFNKGFEITLERFLSKGFYLLSTLSLFDSKYKGSDKILRNTSFNYGYAANLLGGGEWKLGKAKRNAFTFDFKLTSLGGRYVTPINLPASIAANTEILDETKYNTIQQAGYFRLDTKFGLRQNSKKRKISQTFYLDFQNVTNQKNIFLTRYNPVKKQIGSVNQIGFFPDVLYRITF